MTTAETIVRVVRSYRLDLSDEKRMQAELAEAFAAEGIACEREVRLTAADIPDFLTPDGVAVECKLRGQGKKAIFRQMGRYCAHERVRALVLVTNVAMGLPPVILGKPVYYATLSRGWL